MKIRLQHIILSLMMMISIVTCLSCKEKNIIQNQQQISQVVVLPDTAIKTLNGILFYHDTVFTGKTIEKWPNGNLHTSQFFTNGKQQGLSETFYINGTIASRRWYLDGEKDSVHTGWWENGNKKYEYPFNKGVYNGLFTEWYEQGTMMQQVMYQNGQELYGKGWRENGKVYMNFVMKNGRRYGMNNSNLCYGLKSLK